MDDSFGNFPDAASSLQILAARTCLIAPSLSLLQEDVGMRMRGHSQHHWNSIKASIRRSSSSHSIVSAMKIISALLLFTALALESATSWHSSSYKARAQKAGYFDSQGYYHRAAETANIQKEFPATGTHQQATNHRPGLSTTRTEQQSSYTCQSASYVDTRSSRNISTYLHVCESGGSSGEFKIRHP